MKRILICSIAVLFVSGVLISQEIKYDIAKPDSSSDWAKGSSKTITWNKKGDTWPEVKIKLFSYPGMVKALDIENNAANNGSYLWKIPNAGLSVGKYMVRVKTTNDKNWGNSAPFNIIAGSLAFGISKDVLKKVKKNPVFKPPKGFLDPKITFVIDHPLGPLKPGTRVVVKGNTFGQNKGKVLIKGNFPNGQFQLENVDWDSNTRVVGYVPQSVNGQPNQSVKIVLVTAWNKKSNEWAAKFEGREEQLLTQDAVGVQCGTDGNKNTCNQFSQSDDGFSSYFDTNHAICGRHSNVIGAIGDDSGSDLYSIDLKNGWLLKSMEIITWVKSSGNELLVEPSPPFPAGQSVWNTAIKWIVSPNDHVRYEIKIVVEGPIGTNYK